MNLEHSLSRRGQRGYNLVEVLIATAMLGTVLLSVLTLFFVGRRNVYSGKQLTRATSVAQHAIEDLSPLSSDELWKAFGVTSSTTTTNPTIGGVAYTKVIVRTTTADAGNATNDFKGLLTRWNALIPASTMNNGKLTLIFTPGDLITNTDVTSAQVIKIRVLMQWNENSRPRQVVLDTIKMNRV